MFYESNLCCAVRVRDVTGNTSERGRVFSSAKRWPERGKWAKAVGIGAETGRRWKQTIAVLPPRRARVCFPSDYGQTTTAAALKASCCKCIAAVASFRFKRFLGVRRRQTSSWDIARAVALIFVPCLLFLNRREPPPPRLVHLQRAIISSPKKYKNIPYLSLSLSLSHCLPFIVVAGVVIVVGSAAKGCKSAGRIVGK